MDSEFFEQTWYSLHREKTLLESRRDDLEVELAEIRTHLRHIDAAIEHIAPLAGKHPPDSLSEMGMTDAVRFVLRNSQERMSPADVRRQIVDKGFDITTLTAPMASIYKVLGRLVEDDKVVREKEDGRVFYRWKHEDSSGITDDDIPF